MTVFELLTGKKAPLSGTEYNYWLAYFKHAAEQEKKANREAQKKKGPATPNAAAEGPRVLGG